MKVSNFSSFSLVPLHRYVEGDLAVLEQDPCFQGSTHAHSHAPTPTHTKTLSINYNKLHYENTSICPLSRQVLWLV